MSTPFLGTGWATGREVNIAPPGIIRTLLLARAPAHRRRVAGQLERSSGVYDLVAVHAQDRDVLVDEVSDIDIAPVVAENHAFGQAAHLDLLESRHGTPQSVRACELLRAAASADLRTTA